MDVNKILKKQHVNCSLLAICGCTNAIEDFVNLSKLELEHPEREDQITLDDYANTIEDLLVSIREHVHLIQTSSGGTQ